MSSSTATSSTDWRSSLSVSDRNQRVRQIAAVLASIEKNASEKSKLGLAMRFEENVFKGATSLDDYRKKIDKRLSRLKKSYKPSEDDSAETSRREQMDELRLKYGDKIRFVVEHGADAVGAWEAQEPDKAQRLAQHIQQVKLFAQDLGISVVDKNQSNNKMADANFSSMKQHLEQRLDNVRHHVLRLVNYDEYNKELLQIKQDQWTKDPGKQRASKVLAVDMQQRYQQVYKTAPDLQEAWQRARVPIPVVTRGNPEQAKAAALAHIRKMKAASLGYMAYLATNDKSTVPSPELLAQFHQYCTHGIAVVRNVIKEHRRVQERQGKLALSDAWMKNIVWEDAAVPGSKWCTKSSVLLRPGRAISAGLVAALKAKGAILVRPPPQGAGSHVVLEFGSVFCMTIFLQPLLVTIRAYYKPASETLYGSHAIQCPSMRPLYQGLVDRQEDLHVYDAKGGYDVLGSVVEERLRDAGMRATHVLRRLFAARSAAATKEFELEIVESGALLEFIQLARTSYLPDWEDIVEMNTDE